MTGIDPIKLPFAEAIEFFSEKTNLDTDSWCDTLDIDNDAVFTSAAAKGQLLQDLRDAVAIAQSEGKSVQDFLAQFDKIADRYSPDWLGKGDRAWRGQLIYEQNIRTAHNAGREQQMNDPDVVKLRPYQMWRHGDSRQPRPAHLALDGKVFEAGKVPLRAGCGFNCKCQIFSLSRREFVREGLSLSTLKLGDEIDGVPIVPDPGFERTKEQVRKDTLDRFDPKLKKQVNAEINSAEFRMIEGTTKVRNGKTYILRDSRWHSTEEQIDRVNYKYKNTDNYLEIDGDGELHHFRTFTDDSWEVMGSEHANDRIYKFAVPKELGDRIWEIIENPTQQGLRDLMAELERPKAAAKRIAAIDELVDNFKAGAVGGAQTREVMEANYPNSLNLIEGLKALHDRDAATAAVGRIAFSRDLSASEQAELKDAAIEFFQITGKQDLNVKIMGKTPDRSYCMTSLGSVAIEMSENKIRQKSDIFHEIAHMTEHGDRETMQAANAFVLGRATGPKQLLNDLTISNNYGNEKAYPDNFFDPYIGKTYENGSTEVHSMGLQMFSNPHLLSTLYQRDPDHFDLMIRYIKSGKGDR